MPVNIDPDEALACRNRCLRTLPDTRLLGPTGARLWADFLEQVPGFAGAFDFIHKCNIPLLFSVEPDFRLPLELGESIWKPSHLDVRYEDGDISYREIKFISWDDCAVSEQTWENRGRGAKRVRLSIDSDRIKWNVGAGFASGLLPTGPHDFQIRAVIVCNPPALREGLELAPGRTVRLTIAAALGIEGVDSEETLLARARRFALDGTNGAVLKIQRREYLEWFARIPTFSSSDPLLDKTWLYRWFILRHNLADPRYGRLQHPLFYEGRSHKMGKTPGLPEGWEFSKLIPLSSPLHLLEIRWHHDPAYGRGLMETVKAGQDERGLFNCLYVDEVLHSYANFMGWAALQFYLVHRDEAFLESALPALKKQVDGEASVYGNDRDSLLIEYNHKRTGKEYQPSYWYFHDFPDDCLDESTYTPVKRVDRSVYHYMNCLGVATLCEAAGDPESARYREMAGRVRRDLLDKMWDEREQFFFDLHYADDRKARVKNVVGFYPFWAEMTLPDHRGMLLHLTRKDGFATRCPLPSVSTDCPVYAPEGGWKGRFIKGRNGCMWNGPAWPYTNSIVLDGLAKESKRNRHADDGLFAELFRKYAWMHFAGRDLSRPYLVEHYNSQTGEAVSDEVDYNHSYFIDLVIRHVAGLEVEGNRVIVDPVDVGLDYFDLDNVHVRGRILRVTYGNPQAGDLPVKKGLRLFVNGEEAAAGDALCRLMCEL
jgi:hypothetical protein